MSQRECAGSNWPPLSIPAQEPVSICPKAVSRTGPANIAKSLRLLPCLVLPIARFAWPPPVQSLACVVGQPASTAAWFSVTFGVGVKSCAGDLFESQTVAVGQPANLTTSFNGGPLLPRSCTPAKSAPFQSRACGVGHPIQPLSDVRSTDARSAQIGRCAGVIRCFQVSLYKVEPSEAVSACNLFAKDN